MTKDGSPVTVLFDPQNYDRFRLDGFGESGVVFKVVGWVVFAMLGPFPSG